MRSYPLLTPSQVAGINDKLVEVVKLGQAGRLTGAQLAELEACIAIQTGHAETLHRFALTNADEPAFIHSVAR